MSIFFLKKLVDVSKYSNDGKELSNEHPTPIEIRYKKVRGEYSVSDTDMPKQVPNSVSIYNNPRYHDLYYEVKKKLEDQTNLRLYPTYYYERLYRPGNVLTKHTDREACEVSVSLNLSSSLKKPWAIYFEQGTIVKYLPKPGDAVLYNGVFIPHWRDPMQGGTEDYYHQVFFHYVDADGPFVHRAFDQ